MEYYPVNSTGTWGGSLSSCGLPRPDTSGMSVAKAQEAIKEWRVLQKAHTNKMQREHRTLFGSNAAMEIEYSGVVDARFWLCPKPFTGIEEHCLEEVYKGRSRLSKCDEK
jgi:hypothetical protein